MSWKQIVESFGNVGTALGIMGAIIAVVLFMNSFAQGIDQMQEHHRQMLDTNSQILKELRKICRNTAKSEIAMSTCDQ